jgi:cell wall-associated NlpC family hydrolase
MHAHADAIVEAARSRVGTPYRHQGRGPHHYDCVGLLIDVAHELGLTSFDTASYGRRPNVEEFTRFMRESGCTRLAMEELAHGDILRMAYDKWPVHTGIFVRTDRGFSVIHAFLPYRKVVEEDLTEQVWARVNAVWRFPE